MSIILNILWFILGGFLVSLAYIPGGILLCLTIADHGVGRGHESLLLKPILMNHTGM